MALSDAVSAAASANPSPQAFRELVRAVDALRPFHDRELEARAERKLVFMALPSLMARADDPLADQVAALGTTVWPTALGVAPLDDESPEAFLERTCGEKLARECKYVVPTYRSLVVSEIVWRRLKHRARSAFAACRDCADDPSYARALAAFDTHQTAVSSRRARVGERLHPRRWPRAAGHSAVWPAHTPLLVIHANGRSEFRGESIDYGGWRRAIADERRGAEVLGVHLRPTADVALLRDLVDTARRAGYRDVALAAIAPDYPFERRAYLLAARDRGRAVRVRVRDVDTIQVLIQALSVHLDAPEQRARL